MQHHYISLPPPPHSPEGTDLGAHGHCHGVGEHVDALQHQRPDLGAKLDVLGIVSRQVVPRGLASDGSSQ